jgi:prepilin signal peptidase PulO-like enzyme (type II secretory pathway)
MPAVILLSGLLGWLLGVAANALADSLPLDRRLHRPRCAGCTVPRPWRALSAIVGAAAGAAVCAYCGRRRGARAVVVELAAAASAVLLALRDSRPAILLPALAVGSVFLLIAIIDMEHRLILHVVVLPAALVLGLMQALDPGRGPVKTLLGGLAGAGSFFLLYLLGEVFARLLARARGRALDEVAFGFGDVTLAGLIGLVVGWPAVVLALLVGILAAGAFSLGYLVVMLVRRRYTAFTPIPYGPFLILGACLVYYGGKGLFQSILLG